MSKRILSILLAIMLVFAYGSQAVIATEAGSNGVQSEVVEPEKAIDLNDILETEVDLDEVALEINENEYIDLEVSMGNQYMVYKYVPDATEEYFIFINSGGGDSHVCVCGQDGEGSYTQLFLQDDSEDGDLDPAFTMELEENVVYYFLLSSLDTDTTLPMKFAISSDYKTKEAFEQGIYGAKKVENISFSNLPKHEWYAFEDISSIRADINIKGLNIAVNFEDGSVYSETLQGGYDLSDENHRWIGSQCTVLGKTYKIYWKYLKDDFGAFYMDDEAENNALCISFGEEIREYPVRIIENPIKSIAVKNDFTNQRQLVTELETLEDLNYDGLVITATCEDDSSYDVTWNSEGYFEGTNGFEVKVDAETVLDEYGNPIAKLGENNVTITYAGQTTQTELFLYSYEKFEAVSPLDAVSDTYAFQKDIPSLAGLTVRATYTDGTTEDFAADENNVFDINGYSYDVTLTKNTIYLEVPMLDAIEVGTVTYSKSMEDFPGLKTMTPGVSEEVTLDGGNTVYAVFKFVPEKTAEYKFYSAMSENDQEAYDTYGILCDETGYLTYNDDDEDSQFGIKYTYTAGETYYLVAKMCEESVAGNFICRLEEVVKLQQVITAPDSITKKTTDEPFRLSVSTLDDAELYFESSNPAVATVEDGMVTIYGAGTTTITVTARENDEYAEATKEIVLTVTEQGTGGAGGSSSQPNSGGTGSSSVQPNPGGSGQEQPAAPQKVTIHVNKSTITKTYGARAFKLNATSNGKMTYTSGNKKVATVDKNGKVTVKKCGKAVITIKSAADGYLSATKKVVIKVVPKKASVKSVKSKKAGQITVTWKKRKEAKGYIIEYSTDKNFKKNVKKVKVSKNSTTSKTIKKLRKGKTYYVRVKAYTSIDKKAATGTASAKKRIKVKK